jgi:hypothetical protein
MPLKPVSSSLERKSERVATAARSHATAESPDVSRTPSLHAVALSVKHAAQQLDAVMLKSVVAAIARTQLSL